MSFYYLTGKKGLSFAKPLTPTLVDPAQATHFADEKKAKTALASALSHAVSKLRAYEAKRDTTVKYYLDRSYIRLRDACDRLEHPLLVEEASTANVSLDQWAIVVADGRWLHLRGGYANLTPHPHEAATFGSEKEAREIGQETHWTKAAADMKDTAAIVRLAVQFHSATPLFGTPKRPGPLNAFVSQWVATHERNELAKDLSGVAPVPAAHATPSSTEPEGSTTPTPHPKTRRRI